MHSKHMITASTAVNILIFLLVSLNNTYAKGPKLVLDYQVPSPQPNITEEVVNLVIQEITIDGNFNDVSQVSLLINDGTIPIGPWKKVNDGLMGSNSVMKNQKYSHMGQKKHNLASNIKKYNRPKFMISQEDQPITYDSSLGDILSLYRNDENEEESGENKKERYITLNAQGIQVITVNGNNNTVDQNSIIENGMNPNNINSNQESLEKNMDEALMANNKKNKSNYYKNILNKMIRSTTATTDYPTQNAYTNSMKSYHVVNGNNQIKQINEYYTSDPNA